MTFQTDFLDDHIFRDDDDDDYLPPAEKTKSKFKKPTLADIKVFKAKKPVVRKVKVIKQYKQEPINDEDTNDDYFGDMKSKTTTITCCECFVSLMIFHTYPIAPYIYYLI